MPDSRALQAQLAENILRSASPKVPQYHIAFGKDRILEWTPGTESPELAFALSYHFPKQNSLEGKMRAAVHLFLRTSMKRPEQARPNFTLLSGKKSASKEEQADIIQDSEISSAAPETETVSRTNSLVNSSQLIDVVKIREPILDIAPPFSSLSEIIWKADTGEEVQLKPKKRQYTERERVEVGNNRGNVCKEHRQKKQKCNPLTCLRNKQYLKNNSEGQRLANQGQSTVQDDSIENPNGIDHDNLNPSSNYVSPTPRKDVSADQTRSIEQTPIDNMSAINGAGFIVPSQNLPILTGIALKLAKITKEQLLSVTLDPSSPVLSPDRPGSPLNTLSPRTSYFDDAWVGSPDQSHDEDTPLHNGHLVCCPTHLQRRSLLGSPKSTPALGNSCPPFTTIPGMASPPWYSATSERRYGDCPDCKPYGPVTIFSGAASEQPSQYSAGIMHSHNYGSLAPSQSVLGTASSTQCGSMPPFQYVSATLHPPALEGSLPQFGYAMPNQGYMGSTYYNMPPPQSCMPPSQNYNSQARPQYGIDDLTTSFAASNL